MTAPPSLPSLFGRFTAILQDHEHLGATMERLRAMCVGLETRDPALAPTAPARLLEDLRTELSRHFAAEESESYFGTMASEAPLLIPAIAQLKSDHATMLAATAALCRVADDATRKPELCVGTRQLIADFERHERTESLLLRDFFAPRPQPGR